ncbi:membrane protein [Beggiatoa sp. PS]|nr:membrane protein [Beggiatoa sp. PS]
MVEVPLFFFRGAVFGIFLILFFSQLGDNARFVGINMFGASRAVANGVVGTDIHGFALGPVFDDALAFVVVFVGDRMTTGSHQLNAILFIPNGVTLGVLPVRPTELVAVGIVSVASIANLRWRMRLQATITV